MRNVRGSIRWGLSNGLPIALGYLPVAVTFGILGRQAGLSVAAVTGMSAWVYAGASQFLALKMIAAGTGYVEIIPATLILNFRHFLMSTVLARLFPGLSEGWTLIAATLGVSALGTLLPDVDSDS